MSIIDKAKAYYEQLPFDRLPHVKRVLVLAERIGAGEGLLEAELRLLRAAALLHDIGYVEQHEQGDKEHPSYGAQAAERLLVAEGWTAADAHAVADIIRTHSNAKNCKTQLQRLLHDADKADRCSMGGVIRRGALYHEKGLDEEAMVTKTGKKLRELALFSDTAKRLVREQKRFLLGLVDEYEAAGEEAQALIEKL